MLNIDSVDLVAIARQALVDRGFRTDFPQKVLKEVEGAQEPDFSAIPFRDLTGLPWSSIDNDDSRDLDQIECVEMADGKPPRVYVAIANVSHFVPDGSPTDLSARQNTTSIYTGVETFPMLPERLSTDLSSLNEDGSRLAIVVQMDIDGSAVSAATVYPAIVRNKAQLTYTGVNAFLEDAREGASAITLRVLARIDGDAELREQLCAQDKIAQGLRQARFAAGALDFKTPELRPMLHADGTIELSGHESNRATQLIEEFMIASNTSVAAHMESRRLPCIQRVVQTPKNWSRIVTLASQRGWDLPAVPDGEALQAFLADQHRKDPDRFPDLSLAVIKLLGRGEYVVKRPGQEGIGHFGIGAANYLHGSAANRRYADLADQRILLDDFAGRAAGESVNELETLAQWCTSREGDAKKVERQVHKSIAAVALAPRIGEIFPGFITGASDKGVFVRIADPPVEGKVSGRNGGLEVGNKVQVRLVSTDPYRGYIDFEVAGR